MVHLIAIVMLAVVTAVVPFSSQAFPLQMPSFEVAAWVPPYKLPLALDLQEHSSIPFMDVVQNELLASHILPDYH